ncbi:MAG: PEBP family protein [Candidatus Peregrinibacteria bacterium Greene1014_49]|nr:MAG: PEBP family protein [Candidatus Peregrinibacteria bacterium Greene1014_49]
MSLRFAATLSVTCAALSACGFPDDPPPPRIFALESPAFADNAVIPAEYTCDGEGKSPALKIRDVPQGTQSLALVVDDLDAPSGHYVHWVMWDLRPDLTEIPSGSAPAGAMEGTTSAKSIGYVPLCPLLGSEPHRYVFSLYAINDGISLSFEATRAMLEQQMKGKVIAIAKLTGVYERAEEIEN